MQKKQKEVLLFYPSYEDENAGLPMMAALILVHMRKKLKVFLVLIDSGLQKQEVLKIFIVSKN